MRQSFLEPTTGRRLMKDIELRIEEMRHGDEPSPELRLVASCDDQFTSSPLAETLRVILDAKRTFVPYQCGQTQLIKRCCGDTLEVASTERLHVGDPLVLQDASTRHYCLIQTMVDNILTIFPAANFYAGTLVQNLANRGWRQEIELGLVARLAMPEPLPFVIRPEVNGLTLVVSTPLNITVVHYYDVYVRQTFFMSLDPYWFPDALDVEIQQDTVMIGTYHGGIEAGGGVLTEGDYYVTVIAKDRKGRVNVNESPCQFVEHYHFENR